MPFLPFAQLLRTLVRRGGCGLAIIVHLLPGAALAACDREHVTVEGSPTEIALTCDLLSTALHYFTALGFAVEPDVKVTFVGHLIAVGDGIGAVGLFDREHRLIEVTRSGVVPPVGLHLWQQDWGPQLVPVVLLHELVHSTVDQIAADTVPGVMAEFVGSAIQFELMDPDLRRQILDGYHHVTAFAGLSPELGLEYALDPDAFAVRSYLYERANGGPGLIRQILLGRIGIEAD